MSRKKKIIKNLYRHARRGDFKQTAQLFPREIEMLKNLGLSVSNIIKVTNTTKNLYHVVIDWSDPVSELSQELFDLAVNNS